MSAIVLVLRLALALLLLVAAIAKGLDVPGMAAIVHDFRVLPEAATLPAALGVALAEAVVGVALLTRRWRVGGAWASTALHTVYFSWSAVALGRGLAIANCGCFGTLWPRPLSIVTLVEDVVLISVSLILVRFYGRGPS